jgi:hypothetical protein
MNPFSVYNISDKDYQHLEVMAMHHKRAKEIAALLVLTVFRELAS